MCYKIKTTPVVLQGTLNKTVLISSVIQSLFWDTAKYAIWNTVLVPHKVWKSIYALNISFFKARYVNFFTGQISHYFSRSNFHVKIYLYFPLTIAYAGEVYVECSLANMQKNVKAFHLNMCTAFLGACLKFEQLPFLWMIFIKMNSGDFCSLPTIILLPKSFSWKQAEIIS